MSGERHKCMELAVALMVSASGAGDVTEVAEGCFDLGMTKAAAWDDLEAAARFNGIKDARRIFDAAWARREWRAFQRAQRRAQRETEGDS